MNEPHREDREIEVLLASMPLRTPSDALDAKIRDAVRGRRPRRALWALSAAALAACGALAAFLIWPQPEESLVADAKPGQIIEKSVITPLAPTPDEAHPPRSFPIHIEQTMSQTIDGGIFVAPDGTPSRRLVTYSIQLVHWESPDDGMTFQGTIPRAKVSYVGLRLD